MRNVALLYLSENVIWLLRPLWAFLMFSFHWFFNNMVVHYFIFFIFLLFEGLLSLFVLLENLAIILKILFFISLLYSPLNSRCMHMWPVDVVNQLFQCFPF